MEPNEFIELFKKDLKFNSNYTIILEDLNNNVFPFHDRDKHVTSRRYYYWLKQNNSLKFKKLNGELKKLVKNRIRSIAETTEDF